MQQNCQLDLNRICHRLFEVMFSKCHEKCKVL
uniref:Uncharacterized protein n=1 Tax=Anguilla anguilla TaxID=7936 RepID=A0A0E9V4L0_ANGAN